MGLVSGCFKGPKNDSYAGTSARNFWRGVVVKRGVENGVYGHQIVSLKALQITYSD